MANSMLGPLVYLYNNTRDLISTNSKNMYIATIKNKTIIIKSFINPSLFSAHQQCVHMHAHVRQCKTQIHNSIYSLTESEADIHTYSTTISK